VVVGGKKERRKEGRKKEKTYLGGIF